MTERARAILLALSLGPLAVSCASAHGGAAPAEPPRRGQTSFFNVGSELVLGVDVRASRITGMQEILPVQVVVLNRGKADLGLDREGFTLVRPDGVRLPVASAEEIWRDHPRVKADLRMGIPFLENVFGRYPQPPFHWAGLDLFPEKFTGTVPRDRLELRLGEGAYGYLYFRHPAAGAPPSGAYTLLLRPLGADQAYPLDFVPYDVKQGKR